MAEWSIAAALKAVDPHGSGGSNPSPSASEYPGFRFAPEPFFLVYKAYNHSGPIHEIAESGMSCGIGIQVVVEVSGL